MKKLFLVTMLTTIVYGQEKDSLFVSAEASLVLPLGKLANKFDYAQSYGFWFNMGQDCGLTANFGFNVLLLQNPKSINYSFKDSIYKINSNKFGLDFGIRAVKKIDLTSENKTTKYFEIGTTLGITYLDYDYPKQSEEDKKKNNGVVFRNTTLLSTVGISYMYRNVGLNVQYRLTPYNFIEEMESKFGSHSFAFGIVYKQ